MTGFNFETTPRIVCEQGGSGRLAEFARGLGVRHFFLITDQPLLQAGLLAPALANLRVAGITTTVYSDVLPDPPEERVLAAVRAAREAGADGVVGFGGGSSMDTAKLVALLARTPAALQDIYGIGLAQGPRLPLVQVPTTAGTGSEVTPIAIVTTSTSEKKGVVSPLLYPDFALLDSHLTLGLPPRLTAMTGIDAMVHAIEAFTSRHKKNPVSDALALKALALLYANQRKVLEDPRNGAAREHMLLGSLLAGMAFANAPVAAVHALAYPLGGHFHVPHGLSNALVLRPVLRFNLEHAAPLYAQLGEAIGTARSDQGPIEGARAFVDAMAALVAVMPFEQNLRSVGVDRSDLPMLAEDALKVQRLLVNNPRDVALADALALYEEAF
ncbi:iron-containing alcohol dehydrogenase [Variovorax paradoxus]|uniref:iron-containing alcohol dehydrogenase n=1 Tax=Variovorax paradoxus TaxID=34073 RepID=UPI00037D8136|nr:iron-containing alcohol dehydrogenase [Variovorax paradoxus]